MKSTGPLGETAVPLRLAGADAHAVGDRRRSGAVVALDALGVAVQLDQVGERLEADAQAVLGHPAATQAIRRILRLPPGELQRADALHAGAASGALVREVLGLRHGARATEDRVVVPEDVGAVERLLLGQGEPQRHGDARALGLDHDAEAVLHAVLLRLASEENVAGVADGERAHASIFLKSLMFATNRAPSLSGPGDTYTTARLWLKNSLIVIGTWADPTSTFSLTLYVSFMMVAMATSV